MLVLKRLAALLVLAASNRWLVIATKETFPLSRYLCSTYNGNVITQYLQLQYMVNRVHALCKSASAVRLVHYICVNVTIPTSNVLTPAHQQQLDIITQHTFSDSWLSSGSPASSINTTLEERMQKQSVAS